MATNDQSIIPNSAYPTKPFIIVSLSYILKLTPTNYISWKPQIEATLIGYDLHKFIDGSNLARPNPLPKMSLSFLIPPTSVGFVEINSFSGLFSAPFPTPLFLSFHNFPQFMMLGRLLKKLMLIPPKVTLSKSKIISAVLQRVLVQSLTTCKR
ncbi:hypothetical protein HRI_000417000 [Hibiscus trionum]|uniref:Retrotransposon Copia-like N-terminal domain-containing protein n=1 Tax=Hibiscus trionum TaxID=183268 RepID=A0A9W7GXQ6_HIBTR|nr:hypothetical protein HRI_000417000 [Hibiscus trionum]